MSIFEIVRRFAGRGPEPEPDPARALNRRGVEALRGGDRGEALRLFAEALSVDPQCVPAIVSVGNMLLEEGAIDEAIAHYEAALRYDDRFALAHHNLGVALRRRGDRGASVRHLRRATRLELTSWATRLSRRRA